MEPELTGSTVALPFAGSETPVEALPLLKLFKRLSLNEKNVSGL
jgi:hypothetical protein